MEFITCTFNEGTQKRLVCYSLLPTRMDTQFDKTDGDFTTFCVRDRDLNGKDSGRG